MSVVLVKQLAAVPGLTVFDCVCVRACVHDYVIRNSLHTLHECHSSRGRCRCGDHLGRAGSAG